MNEQLDDVAGGSGRPARTADTKALAEERTRLARVRTRLAWTRTILAAIGLLALLYHLFFLA